MPENRYFQLLVRAAGTPHGIKIQSDDVAELRKRLHAEAKKHAEFQVLGLRISPVDTDALWIVRYPDETKAKTVPAPETTST